METGGDTGVKTGTSRKTIIKSSTVIALLICIAVSSVYFMHGRNVRYIPHPITLQHQQQQKQQQQQQPAQQQQPRQQQYNQQRQYDSQGPQQQQYQGPPPQRRPHYIGEDYGIMNPPRGQYIPRVPNKWNKPVRNQILNPFNSGYRRQGSYGDYYDYGRPNRRPVYDYYNYNFNAPNDFRNPQRYPVDRRPGGNIRPVRLPNLQKPEVPIREEDEYGGNDKGPEHPNYPQYGVYDASSEEEPDNNEEEYVFSNAREDTIQDAIKVSKEIDEPVEQTEEKTESKTGKTNLLKALQSSVSTSPVKSDVDRGTHFNISYESDQTSKQNITSFTKQDDVVSTSNDKLSDGKGIMDHAEPVISDEENVIVSSMIDKSYSKTTDLNSDSMGAISEHVTESSTATSPTTTSDTTTRSYTTATNNTTTTGYTTKTEGISTPAHEKGGDTDNNSGTDDNNNAYVRKETITENTPISKMNKSIEELDHKSSIPETDPIKPKEHDIEEKESPNKNDDIIKDNDRSNLAKDESTTDKKDNAGLSKSSGNKDAANQAKMSNKYRDIPEPVVSKEYGHHRQERFGIPSPYLLEPDPEEDPDDYDCMSVRTLFSMFKVCVCEGINDTYASEIFNNKGSWKSTFVRDIQLSVLEDKDTGFIDIGAGVGVISMAVASLGRKVVAVEPHLTCLQAMRQSLVRNKYTSLVKVFNNLVSNDAVLMAKTNENGQEVFKPLPAFLPHNREDAVSSISLNDLSRAVSYSQFSKAVLKVDMPGFIGEAFEQADDLFDRFKIDTVVTKWDTHNRELCEFLVDFFQKKGYRPYSGFLSRPLDPKDALTWWWKYIMWKKGHL